ncbi:hypothetical protein TVAG_533930 [Trichomonas vaginalis G3]|uniref:Uncharacterized protein n=1 Tax=Trichomonas vaginalis (strain ATCC PRA-98 / G3) TaxID=412133 RepID=A2G1P0_TRIV3|nr:hypothetical protein TVAGG3_0750290 [Trichomonas vaginalis G3]EAX88926.1 hypothetical protein TVAG_533930 [Trichomonas vaginalis G3]KAI5512495.1 hypothetical protein TVAGG3_0750290 [Trichomonas vaginalis G3]|eukprot:XP_001301856.1 hypothetical protein [Trichomonas vaginalis G3]
MSFAELAKVGGVLGGLGFVTTLAASLLTCFSIASRVCSIVVGGILVGAGVFYGFLGWKTDAENHARSMKFFAAVASLVTGILYIFLPSSFHTGSYLNRMVVYILPLVSISVDLALQWPFITSFIIQGIIDTAHLGAGKEHVLYSVFNIFTAFIAATLIPISNAGTNSQICSSGIVYSIAAWFIACIVFFLVGFKLTRTKGEALNSTTSYNKVGQ